MQSSFTSMPQQSILMVMVAYGQAPSKSQSFRTLCRVLNNNPELAKYFSLVIYDNSLQADNCQYRMALPVLYRHDPSNPGLAKAYNFALRVAEEKKHEWLLLLDQDTSLTEGFIAELLECTELLRTQSAVASIVPKLLCSGKIYSPLFDFIYHLRHQYRRSNHAVSRDTTGVQKGRLSAYNSGASLRVSALQSIGGFPGEYWLDYLDHAVFHRLATRGYAMYVMQTNMEHDMSQAEISSVSAWRQRNLISAQTQFVKQTGTILDRFLYRIWLIRCSRILWLHHPDRSLWKETAIHALTLRRCAQRMPGEGQ
jgi:GT2 family glycosyltransferase